jgi:hypothetical protein
MTENRIFTQAADKISKHSEKHYSSYHTTYCKNPIFRHIKSNNSGTTKVKIVKNERDISSLLVKRGGSPSFLVGTISNVMVMEIGWTDVGRGGIS